MSDRNSSHGGAQVSENDAEEDFLSFLNDAQREAVLCTEGPVLILAGAGTGKTRTITSRVGHIVRRGLASPDQILAVTFTNKAAQEMLTRVSELVSATGIWLGTFHSISARILRGNAELVGLRSDFTIVGTDDQLQLVKTIVHDTHPGYPADSCKKIMHSIQRWKEKGLLPQDVAHNTQLRHSDGFELEVYHRYQERLKILNCADFGDLLLHNVTIMTSHPTVLAHYQEQFRYVMVDEYQDTNTVQYFWLKLLVQKRKNICCVGDDDQSIYSWRGAEIKNILRFSEDFPKANIIRLECNYRSTANILGAASAVISNNKSRLEKTLWTTNQEGQKVGLVKFWDSRFEAQYITEHILNSNEYRFKDTAILVRASFQTRVFEEYFVRYRLPYKIIGSTKFYDRQEIRDLVAYLRTATNPDNDIAFDRIVNKPKRQIGASTVNKMRACAQKYSVSLYRAGELMVQEKLLPERTARTLEELFRKFRYWREMLDSGKLVETMQDIAYGSGYMDMLKAEGEQGASRIENIKELFTAVANFSNATQFLEHISLVTEIADPLGGDDDYVYMMTLHAAKGLEFPMVFLPGWEEGVFPHEKSMNDSTGEAIEEERRLAYVGITRAMEKLLISCASVRDINNWKQPMRISRFIKELPPENVQVIKNTGCSF